MVGSTQTHASSSTQPSSSLSPSFSTSPSDYIPSALADFLLLTPPISPAHPHHQYGSLSRIDSLDLDNSHYFLNDDSEDDEPEEGEGREEEEEAADLELVEAERGLRMRRGREVDVEEEGQGWRGKIAEGGHDDGISAIDKGKGVGGKAKLKVVIITGQYLTRSTLLFGEETFLVGGQKGRKKGRKEAVRSPCLVGLLLSSPCACPALPSSLVRLIRSLNSPFSTHLPDLPFEPAPRLGQRALADQTLTAFLPFSQSSLPCPSFAISNP
jgi:hypothetical protein